MPLSLIPPIHSANLTEASNLFPKRCPVTRLTVTPTISQPITVTQLLCPTVTSFRSFSPCPLFFCPAFVGPDTDCTVTSISTVGCPGRCCPQPPPTVTSRPPCRGCIRGCATTYETETLGCLGEIGLPVTQRETVEAVTSSSGVTSQ